MRLLQTRLHQAIEHAKEQVLRRREYHETTGEHEAPRAVERDGITKNLHLTYALLDKAPRVRQPICSTCRVPRQNEFAARGTSLEIRNCTKFGISRKCTTPLNANAGKPVLVAGVFSNCRYVGCICLVMPERETKKGLRK
jgi:hypothetical protein